MPELVAGCDVILGNEEDAEKVFGIKPEGFDVTATNGEVNAAEFQFPGGKEGKTEPGPGQQQTAR